MNTKKRKTTIESLELLSHTKNGAQQSVVLVRGMLWLCVFSFSLLACLSDSACLAVSSKITRHSSSVDLLKGQTEDIVVGSKGTLQLGRAWEMPVEEFEDVWSINSIVVSGGTVFVGTSPNGGIYKYSLGKLTKIYPVRSPRQQGADAEHLTSDGVYPLESQESGKAEPDSNEPSDANEPNDVNEPDSETVEAEKYLANEHIFAMATDIAGRLLAGISGDKCSLMRLEAGQMETIFEPNDAEGTPPRGGTKYIFAMAVSDGGDIYLGTGPQGKIYQLDSFGKEPQLIYDSSDKNILTLAIGRDGFIYAGSDSRGLVYKINPHTKTATVLYDSDQEEITALLFGDDGDLYAAATSAKIVHAQTKFAAELPLAGRPEPKSRRGGSADESEGGRKLEIANTKKETDGKPSLKKKPSLERVKPGEASYIYKITKDGFVTDIFSEAVVFFTLAAQEKKLFVGTGNDAQLFTIDPDSEQQAIIYEDGQASQITAVVVAGDDVYLGTANPAKLIKLGDGFVSEGTYTSELIDAGQPANWGKLQIEADVPKGAKVLVASRSGNVKDVNDPTFSSWTELEEVTEPIQLRCPLGRFCQYKLVLKSKNGRKSPLVREIAVAGTVPNLAPKVEEVSVSRVEAEAKAGIFKISYKTKDNNDDKLIYKIDFRKVGRTNWIELEDELEADSFEWDGKTVEDGRYEVRVTASDERSNTTATTLTSSRISEVVVVDNTGPIIKEYSIDRSGETITLKLKVFDELSAIGRLHYTLDSNAEWIGTIPDDLVYDTTQEDFTVVIEDLDHGEHIITIKAGDDLGNTTYRTFEVEIAKSEK